MRSKTTFMRTFFLCSFMPLVMACGSETVMQRADEGASTGGALGLLAGVVFGEGDIIEDAARSAFRGAAAGAAVGAISGAIEEGEEKRAVAEAQRARQAEMAKRAQEEKDAFQNLVRIFGKDNVEAYYALQACNHGRAYALADAGETASNADHRLAGVWVKAMAAVDERNNNRAQQEFKRLVAMDPDIDTVEQARMETDRLVLDTRKDRRAQGLPACK